MSADRIWMRWRLTGTDSETGDPVCVSAPGPRAAVRGEQARSYASASGVNGEAVAPGRRSGAAMNKNS